MVKQEQDYRCAKCGELNYWKQYMQCEELSIMLKEDVCFHCAFWLYHISKKDDWRRIRMSCNGNVEAYFIESVLENGISAKSDWAKGFGGAEWFIQLNDGSLIRTDSLWSNGTVPNWALSELPINAKQLTKEQYEELAKG